MPRRTSKSQGGLSEQAMSLSSSRRRRRCSEFREERLRARQCQVVKALPPTSRRTL